MTKEPNISKYEIMCLFQENEKQKEPKKEELIKKIQPLISGELKEKKLETEKLHYEVRVEDYLLFHLTTSPEKIVQIEQIIQQLSIQYLLINLDREKHIKIKKKSSNQEGASAKEEIPSNSNEG